MPHAHLTADSEARRLSTSAATHSSIHVTLNVIQRHDELVSTHSADELFQTLQHCFVCQPAERVNIRTTLLTQTCLNCSDM